jgi:DNA-binding NarL/FixJ family response regulator
VRVVVAEDNYLIREGTRRLLEDSGEVDVVAAVSSGEELIAAVNRLLPDAVLTDIRMPSTGLGDESGRPSMEGIEAAHVIKAEHPTIGVVVLSQYVDETYAFELLRNGTNGLAYLLKDRIGDLDHILHALREVVAGGSVIDQRVVDALVTRRARIADSPLAALSPRELDVLREMAQGRANAAIADALSLSESAVGKHVNAIFSKLGLSGETQQHRRVAAVLTFLRDSGLTRR